MAKKTNPEPVAEPKEEKKMYIIPEFEYWDRVIIEPGIDVYEVEESEDSYLQSAVFYNGCVGTVVDIWQYKTDDSPVYTVKLDLNLGSEYDDKTKYVSMSEAYLEYRDCDDDDCEEDYSITKTITDLAKEKINNPLSDVGEILTARTILDAFEKAEKYDALKK